MKLSKFYEVLPRNNLVLLTNENSTEIYYEGATKGIPDDYDDYDVIRAGVSDDGEWLFQLTDKMFISKEDNYEN